MLRDFRVVIKAYVLANASIQRTEALLFTDVTMNQPQPNNPLHGVTLKAILETLVAEYGWQRLGDRININCFTSDPSINSSLKFLRKTDWAREKVERLYLDLINPKTRRRQNNSDLSS